MSTYRNVLKGFFKLWACAGSCSCSSAVYLYETSTYSRIMYSRILCIIIASNSIAHFYQGGRYPLRTRSAIQIQSKDVTNCKTCWEVEKTKRWKLGTGWNGNNRRQWTSSQSLARGRDLQFSYRMMDRSWWVGFKFVDSASARPC